ncbi:hypothetical protein [Clostridium ganghwense]|uniref:Uncharacterized protein n=1 Tax=Clostridium ganghwense TaxID=312089 RepID=A0ABT4CP26_9CLOT|nr:hypothetical protein [Clostridium ganghwense]MCY6370698.1 hypothetical protein [Clostridium ganghwense]
MKACSVNKIIKLRIAFDCKKVLIGENRRCQIELDATNKRVTILEECIK